MTKDIPTDIHEISHDPFVHHYNFFKNNLSILSRIDNIFEKSIDDYIEKTSKQTIPTKTKQNDKENLENKIIWHFGVNNDFLELFLNTHKGILQFRENFLEVVREMALTYIISQFELMLENNFIYIFGNIPELLKSKEKTLNYEEILSYNKLEDVQERISYKEAKNIVGEEIEKINQILKERYQIIDLSVNDDWCDFKERFYRRNLIIHHMLFVDETYRIKTGYSGKKSQLFVDQQYLLESFKIFQKYSKIIHEAFVKKFRPVLSKKMNRDDA